VIPFKIPEYGRGKGKFVNAENLRLSRQFYRQSAANGNIDIRPFFVENSLRFPVKDAVEIHIKSGEFCALDLTIVAWIWVDKNSFGHPRIFACIQPMPKWHKQLQKIEVGWTFW